MSSSLEAGLGELILKDFESDFLCQSSPTVIIVDQQVSAVSIRPLDSPQWTLEWASGFDDLLTMLFSRIFVSFLCYGKSPFLSISNQTVHAKLSDFKIDSLMCQTAS